jgi:phage gp36-like protein
MAAYCTRSDIEMIFGAKNVALWADLDATEDATDIDNRIQAAINVATAEVDSILSSGPFRLPIADSPTTTPTLIREVTATLAGVYLYEGRGAEATVMDQGQPIHPYMFKRLWAMSVLQDLKAGRRRIPMLT